MQLRDPPPRVEPRINARFSQVNAESIHALAVASGWHNDDVVRQRFATGRRCFAAWVQDELAAYGWVSRRPEHIGEQERDIKLESDDAYIWECATLPQYRGQRLYSALLSHIVAVLREEGVRRAWIGATLDNHASLRGFVNAGFQSIVEIAYARVLNLRALWIAPQPKAPPELVAAARRAWIADDEHAWGSFVWSWARRVPSSRQTEIEAQS
jgi:ribosomal protein S18 acetylase RimI-like enzyme